MTPWENWVLNTELNRLKSQINIIKQFNYQIDKVPPEISPEQLISLSCQMVCISICGSLEQGLKKTFLDYAQCHSKNENQWVVRLAEKQVKRFKNPAPEQINELVNIFDPHFDKEVEESLDDGELSQAGVKLILKELRSKRINFAHEINDNHVAIIVSDLEKYLEAYETFFRRLRKHFLRA